MPRTTTFLRARALSTFVPILIAGLGLGFNEARAVVSPTGIVSYSGGVYTQDFNFIGGVAFPPGFFGQVNGNAAPTSSLTGSATTLNSTSANGFYNLAVPGGNPERAFGSFNGNAVPGQVQFIGLEIQNTATTNTGNPINVRFDIENYGGGTSEPFSLFAFISPTALSTGTGAGTFSNKVNQLDPPGSNFVLVSPATTPIVTGGAANSFNVTFSNVNGVSVTPNGWIYLAWRDDTGGLAAPALDNVQFQIIPEPSTAIAAALLVGMVGFGRRMRAPRLELA